LRQTARASAPTASIDGGAAVARRELIALGYRSAAIDAVLEAGALAFSTRWLAAGKSWRPAETASSIPDMRRRSEHPGSTVCIVED